MAFFTLFLCVSLSNLHVLYFVVQGQYGHYMGIQANTINDWGCGPDGPLSCTVGTTPSQHFSTKGVQMLSPLYTKNTQPTRSWNGLPEGYKFDPYLDLEHPFDRVSADPWSGEVFSPAVWKCFATLLSLR
jgi:hypothetical protein